MTHVSSWLEIENNYFIGSFIIWLVGDPKQFVQMLARWSFLFNTCKYSIFQILVVVGDWISLQYYKRRDPKKQDDLRRIALLHSIHKLYTGSIQVRIANAIGGVASSMHTTVVS